MTRGLAGEGREGSLTIYADLRRLAVVSRPAAVPDTEGGQSSADVQCVCGEGGKGGYVVSKGVYVVREAVCTFLSCRSSLPDARDEGRKALSSNGDG